MKTSTVIALAILLALLSAPIQTVGLPPITLITTLHTNPIPLETFDLTIVTPTRWFLWNFTVDLAGKDVGSDRFDLVVDAATAVGFGDYPSPLILLFSDQNLTTWLSMPLTPHSGQRLAYAAFTPTFLEPGDGTRIESVTINFLPPANGIYHIVIMTQFAFQAIVPGVESRLHIEIHGYETWTMTILGRN